MSIHISLHLSPLAFAAAAILIGLIAQALNGFWREARRYSPGLRPGAPGRSPRAPRPAGEEQLQHPLAIDFDFPAPGQRRPQERPRDLRGGSE